ncbi:gluconate 2-dehydrogenase subunit 3 family protein [Arthrobacter sp. NyZ413]|uniref:gluconate 2-dehydrogenase subunit 3 family protein n=1 Tax=Arthrobacter sp. NyZ413 TaxID=3144669 RepID=UPI002CF98171|nr:gluconate 2-dehydrogenase subunit 3 family protein [Arthrobacter sp.]
MSMLPLDKNDGGGRYPGFSTLAQADSWDQATAGVVLGRIGPPPEIRFFTPQEEATAAALLDQLLGQRAEPRVPVVNFVDSRLAEKQTDGWRYEDLPEDGEAWRKTLAALDHSAEELYFQPFAECPESEQAAVLQSIQDLGNGTWQGMRASRVWGLWTRYAATAFYSHPWAWDEIGFGGPAYPRGYKNLGIDRRESFEVADASPGEDPLAAGPAALSPADRKNA